MTKNFILRLCLMMATVLSLCSCQQELLQTEQDAALQSRKLNVQRLNHEQLQQKHSLTLEKINSLSPKKISGRTYTDAENGFSADTEKAILIEDDKGSKSYTFEISRSQPNTELYENLVLKDMGNNTYSAFIMQYKKTLFQLTDALSDEELKNYITIQDLGTKSGTAIFGKTLVCYKVFPNNSYFPGTPCINGHTDPATCDLTGDAAPIPGYWMTGYDVMPYLCDNEPNPFSTVPLEGGGGSLTGNGGLTSRCNKVKKPFTTIPTLAQKSKDFAVKISETKEHGFTVMNNATAGTSNPFKESNGTSETVEISLTPSNKYTYVYHTHNSPAETTYSIFGWADLIWMRFAYLNGAVDSNTVFVVVTADGTKYAMTVDAWEFFNNVFYVRMPNEEFNMEMTTNADRIRGDYFEGQFIDGVWKEPLIPEYSTDKEKDLGYFLQMMEKNAVSINLFEINDDFTKFTKVSKNINGQLQRSPCN